MTNIENQEFSYNEDKIYDPEKDIYYADVDLEVIAFEQLKNIIGG